MKGEVNPSEGKEKDRRSPSAYHDKEGEERKKEIGV